ETAVEAHLANLSRDLHRLEAAQGHALNRLEVATDERAQRMRKVLDELGVHRLVASRVARAASASGGPFVPWTRSASDPFARQVQRIRAASAAAKALEREISTIPVRRPTAGEA